LRPPCPPFAIDIASCDISAAWKRVRRLPGGHELLTTAEVAERLRVTQRTVRGWVADGTIPAIQLGGAGTHLRIPAAGFERWLWSSRREEG
jgi:excisionase family DNA binding protein